MNLQPTPSSMPEASPSQSRPASKASRIGLGIMVLVGVVLGLLISAAALFLVLLMSMDSGSFVGTLVAVIVLIVLSAGVPGLALWRHRKRSLRGLAAGICAGAGMSVAALIGLGVWTGFDPSAMTQGEIDRALAKITAANREAFYLGDDADGKRLAVISHFDGLLLFEYGGCMDNDEGGCTRPVGVVSQPTKNYGSRGESAEPCELLPPVLGVPAANIGGDFTVFTGSSIVDITYWKPVPNGYNADQQREAELASLLRAVGQPTAAKTLPPPDTATRAFVTQHCRTHKK